MITAGIDIGSISTKTVLLADGEILASRVIFTGYNAEAAGKTALAEALAQTNLEAGAVERIVATGYGRKSVSFAARSVTEIACHASGAYFQNPAVRSVIDIGGQDSKAIVLAEGGRVENFVMNDKCAAGTGRFLEVMARALEADLSAFGDLSARARNPARISSLCTVFAESEVISAIAKGEAREDIVAGIHEAIAARIASMAQRIGVRAPLMMTGGVARNPGVVLAVGKALGLPILTTPHAQINGALGAAILARSA
ncbi:MAG: acyl-CoA dehydratase activase [Syntrophales bacterium]|jgi:predicted CoA-substrate-specific enzyme activase|nr:acyl-CoA dehydratase activase [Syntrophales bacterium]